MKDMDLQGTGSAPHQESSDFLPGVPDIARDAQGGIEIPTAPLWGTLDIEGDGTYALFLAQSRLQKTWILADRKALNTDSRPDQQMLVAVVRAKTTGRMTGWGKTYLLTRMLDALGTMTYRAVNSKQVSEGFGYRCEFTDQSDGSYIKFKTRPGGSRYMTLEMVYEGFRINISTVSTKIPLRVPKNLEDVVDSKTKAAVVSTLGIKTAAALFRRMGERLEWYKSKDYRLVDTDEKFHMMMSRYLQAVQKAHDDGKTVLTGIDTETTGLNVLNLSDSNPFRDNIVAVPFGWEDNKAYLICTDMYYFSNVNNRELFTLFNTLFRRNEDFSFQDIDLTFDGVHYSFNRMNITTAGWNTMFDQMAFATHGCDIFFDEDGRQLFFNLNPDLKQGQEGFEHWGTYQLLNSLKAQTRRNIGHETLELEELFGKGNEDKFRYLQDPELANLYGGADADYTRKNVRLAKAMTDRTLYAQYRKYDMTAAYQMGKAAWNGMPINTEAVKHLGNLVAADLETLKEFIYHYAWLANRTSIQSKAGKLEELLGVGSVPELEELSGKEQIFRYPFTPANHKKLLFDLLGYPVVKRAKKTGIPALDKFVLKKLMSFKRPEPLEVLKEDIPSQSDPNSPLVRKKDFNKEAYPLARVFQTYATLNKEYTSYYKPIVEHDLEGRMFYNFTLARAATRRILSPGQTMKGSLKTLVVAPPGKIFMSFDASQIEYRHMASLAYIRAKKVLQEEHPEDWERMLAETSIAKIHSMMQKEEADYHIETAATMTGVRQHQVTKEARKQYKRIGFGIPYGLGDRSLCESIFGAVNDENMQATKKLLADYYKKQKEIIDLLESTRDSAFVPANISPELRKWLEIGDSHVGIVRNFTGFYRLFILENLTRQRTGRIRRQAGNCIIQGGAAELFRRMLYNFHQGACKAGLNNKVQWVMTVHDELDAIIDGDIDICLLIKVIYENCTLRYKDHIPYYVGINFGANWGEAKDDANELPVIMVQRLIKAYDAGKFSIPSDGNQAHNLLVLKRHYLCDRIEEELKTLIPGLGPGHVWTDEEVELVDKEFSNYIVRAYLEVFSSKDAGLKEKLESWQRAREEYGFGVGFLTERFDTTEDLSLDIGDVDLSIDLLTDDTELEDKQAEENSWFGENELFDHTISSEDMYVDADANGFAYSADENSRDEFEYDFNPNPTNSFDLFVMKEYVRTHVLQSSAGLYTTLTANTKFYRKEKELSVVVRKRFGPGSDTILIIGPTVLKVSNVAASEEDLTWLDKLIAGKE